MSLQGYVFEHKDDCLKNAGAVHGTMAPSFLRNPLFAERSTYKALSVHCPLVCCLPDKSKRTLSHWKSVLDKSTIPVPASISTNRLHFPYEPSKTVKNSITILIIRSQSTLELREVLELSVQLSGDLPQFLRTLVPLLGQVLDLGEASWINGEKNLPRGAPGGIKIETRGKFSKWPEANECVVRYRQVWSTQVHLITYGQVRSPQVHLVT